MLTLSNLTPFSGSRKNRKRVGRGPGSGHGKTACRGQKGQKSRSGASIPAGFQGGQMPLYRQLPKRGFKNPFKKEYGVLNVGAIDQLEVDTIDLQVAQKMGLVKKRHNLFKILGEGEINRPVKVVAHAVSESARKKIEAAGGQIEILS
ncbi:LSU ribosomal protein L15p (L27Ae) [Dissulfuribacter thermophilus]|uniref:Large ribosomal subunit protein uL15 n=1 Tax=Dissulfuribacter thermophilus TaxID=1156395 RepID=A0A1B9F5H6_9BACT|nr:50S ribosomal protein L15 [Dissulfuribacter thermophilus]OCC15065.1 LSU ribosomal protein L15p (L27Ae) [Dissulfuribacter thermophilus]